MIGLRRCQGGVLVETWKTAGCDWSEVLLGHYLDKVDRPQRSRLAVLAEIKQ